MIKFDPKVNFKVFNKMDSIHNLQGILTNIVSQKSVFAKGLDSRMFTVAISGESPECRYFV